MIQDQEPVSISYHPNNYADFQEVVIQPESQSVPLLALTPSNTTVYWNQPQISQPAVDTQLSKHLERLQWAESVTIKQKKQVLQILFGWEATNKYEIYNGQDQLIYKASENSTCCARNCWAGPLRPLTLDIIQEDSDGESKVITIDRPYNCQGCCCPCSLQKIIVSSPPGNVLGSVDEKWGCRPELHISDENGSLVFIVRCPPLCFAGCMCCDHDFPIFSADGETQCGVITKGYRGLMTEFFSDANTFRVEFPAGCCHHEGAVGWGNISRGIHVF